MNRPIPALDSRALLLLLSLTLGGTNASPAADAAESDMPLIGYSELQTNLPGGRHANVRTERAKVMRVDGSGDRLLAGQLADRPDAWTQFSGWSPDGRQAIVLSLWQDPENARWEEEHKSFRFDPGKYQVDSCFVDMASGKITNVTAIDSVSNYNVSVFYLPDGRGLGFTALIGGVSKPFAMDLDGRNKREVSGDKNSGFIYGYSASPDGKQISYHENYQIYISNPDGSEKKHVATGNPFNFGPAWSPDSEWLLFVSGEHGHSNPYIVRRDGTELHKVADNNGYQGWIAFLDVPDFHDGSSDLPHWSADGKSVFYTGQVGPSTELFQVTVDVTANNFKVVPGTLHYHNQPSPDGKSLLYGSKRDGVRQLFLMDLASRAEKQLTHLPVGRAATWAQWQPTSTSPPK